jgi:hypothetical protein
MAKATTKLNAQDRVVCSAPRLVSITPLWEFSLESMAIRGFIVHDRESGRMRSQIANARRSL